MLGEHHDTEESTFIPAINEAMSLKLIQEEHELFEKPLHDLEKYLLSCFPAGAT